MSITVLFFVSVALNLAGAVLALRLARGLHRTAWQIVAAALAVVGAALLAAVMRGPPVDHVFAGTLLLAGSAGIVAGLVHMLRSTSRARTPPPDRLRQMLGRGWDVFVLLNVDGEVLYATESVTRVLGYTVEEYLGSSPFRRLHDEDLDPSIERFQELLRSPGATARAEVRSRHKNGEWRWLEILATNLLDDPEFGAVAVNYRDITDRRQVEEELRRRERELRSLADNAPTVIMRFDRQLRHVFVNRAIEERTGIAATAFIGKTHEELGMPGEVVRLWTDALRRAFDGGREEVLEFEFPTRTGLAFYRSRIVPERNDVGEIQTVLVIGDDITERRKAEQGLERSLSLVRAALEATADGILVVDTDGRIVDFNRRFAELWRIPGHVLAARDDDVAIRHVLEQLEEPDAFVKKIEALYDQPDAESYDVLRFKDGRVFERYSLPQRVGGQSVGRVWSFRDVTSERQSQSALRKSEASYRALVEHATYGIYRSTPDGHFEAANPALVKMLGYASEQEMLALDVARDVYAAPELRDRLIEQYAGAELVSGIEVEWKRKNGSTILVRLSGRPMLAPDGRVECFEMIAEDITEQRALEAQLRQAQKMEAVGQLTGGIAHDFNNLLTVILANADIVDRGLTPDREDLREDLTEVRRAAQRGSDMIRKLLGFSRREVLVLRAVTLSDVVENLMAMLRRVLPESIDVRVIAHDAGAVVRADEGALEQILFNLATNSRDAMPQGGRLRIEIARHRLEREDQGVAGFARPGEYVRLAFSDDGVGMDEATLERIFDPFFTTKPPDVGTGLGMAMTYGLVKQQNGFIDVKSQLGKGTTAYLYFPVVGDRAEESRAVADSTFGGATEGTETILVVEDEPAIRRAAKRLLERKGYTVLLAEDGVEALKVIEAHGDAVKLVISDVVMPRMGGPLLYRALKERDYHVPFVFTSGYALRDVKDGVPLDPAVPFLHKPWDVNDLLGRVRQVLDSQ